MTTIELKQYIYENSKIEYILQEIGCHHIKFHQDKDYYSCANYNGDNVTAINIRNNSFLNVVNWTRQNEFDECSDIITLVQYNKQCSFIDAVKYLHNILCLEYKWHKKPQNQKEKDEKDDPLYVFKKIKQTRERINVDDIYALDEEILDDFIPMLHIDWYRAGIMPWTREKFGIAYSYRRNRIVIPIRHWLTKELVGFNMRTTIQNYEEFGIPKYWITPTYQKSQNIYGLAENYDDIQKAGYVVIYESEKSVLKRDSLLDPTGVAIQGHTLSEEQIRILIGLNVDIVVSMDSDISIDEIRHMCSKFYRIRNVYYTFDKWGIVSEKSSIADMSNKIFNFMMKYKIKYDESEHQQYLKSFEKR